MTIHKLTAQGLANDLSSAGEEFVLVPVQAIVTTEWLKVHATDVVEHLRKAIKEGDLQPDEDAPWTVDYDGRYVRLLATKA